MSAVKEKLDNIINNIMDLKDKNLLLHSVLLEGFSLSINIMKELQENGSRETADISKHLQIITNILGISLEELVKECLKNIQTEDGESTKSPDQETLDFITSDLDDYEKFLAKNSSKESLDFLSKEI
jgi:phosphoribosyl-ATP pyrophosphohydrolase